MLNLLKHSWRSISVHPKRMVLTIFGIIVAAAFFIIANIYSSAVFAMQLEKYDNFNPYTLYVPQSLTQEQYETLNQKFSKTKIIPFYSAQNFILHEENNSSQKVGAKLIATSKDFHEYSVPSVDVANTLEQATLIAGRPFSDEDFLLCRKVAIINYSYCKMFFGDENPLGKTLRMKDHDEFYIVGVLKDTEDVIRTVTKFADANSNIHNDLFIPVYVPENLLMDDLKTIIHGGVAMIFPKVDMSSAQAMVYQTLTSETQRISVYSKESIVSEIIEDYEKINNTLNILMALMIIMSGLSLSIILMFSFKERIPEIAIRKAIGASDSHILAQFSCEAFYYGLLGGVLGIVLGLIIVLVSAPFIMQTPLSAVISSIKLTTLGIPFLASLLSAQLFGFLPAVWATKKNVIAALGGE